MPFRTGARFLPLYEEYSKQNPVECLRVIVDDEPELCEEYSIEFYPTVIIFEKEKCATIGFTPGIWPMQETPRGVYRKSLVSRAEEAHSFSSYFASSHSKT